MTRYFRDQAAMKDHENQNLKIMLI